VILLLALVLALVFLPWPWSLAVIVGAASCEIAIVVFGIRYTRRRRSTVGVDRLIGASAEVVTALAPTGQVRLDGEIWRAHAEAGVSRVPGRRRRPTAFLGPNRAALGVDEAFCDCETEAATGGRT
jgi:membrane protein implicated in regulation of membrane protease activity